MRREQPLRRGALTMIKATTPHHVRTGFEKQQWGGLTPPSGGCCGCIIILVLARLNSQWKVRE